MCIYYFYKIQSEHPQACGKTNIIGGQTFSHATLRGHEWCKGPIFNMTVLNENKTEIYQHQLISMLCRSQDIAINSGHVVIRRVIY